MNSLLIANNVTWVMVIVACWWLAHQYARLTPPGRSISICLGLLGLSTLTTLLARNVGFPADWLIVWSKAVLSVGLTLIIIRRHRKGAD